MDMAKKSIRLIGLNKNLFREDEDLFRRSENVFCLGDDDNGNFDDKEAFERRCILKLKTMVLIMRLLLFCFGLFVCVCLSPSEMS